MARAKPLWRGNCASGFVDRGIPVFFLDGDDMRSGLCSDLGLPRKPGWKTTGVSPRWPGWPSTGNERGRRHHGPGAQSTGCRVQDFGQRLVWIYIHAPLDVCVARDPKGLYQRAKAGNVQDLLSFPFEVPRPQERENYIDTVAQNVEGCYTSILELAQAQLSDFAI